MTSGIFGGGDVSGIESALTGLVPQFSQYAADAAGMAPQFGAESATFNTEGQNIYTPSFNQFSAGAQGQITPSQQAAVDQTLQQQNLQTQGTYGNLGLGGSTMNTQDTNANAAKSLAQTQQFSNMDELTGLSGLQSALGYQNAGLTSLVDELGAYTGAGGILSGATGALSSAGSLAAGQQATQLGLLQSAGSALGGLGGKGGAGSSFF